MQDSLFQHKTELSRLFVYSHLFCDSKLDYLVTSNTEQIENLIRKVVTFGILVALQRLLSNSPLIREWQHQAAFNSFLPKHSHITLPQMAVHHLQLLHHLLPLSRLPHKRPYGMAIRGLCNANVLFTWFIYLFALPLLSIFATGALNRLEFFSSEIAFSQNYWSV